MNPKSYSRKEVAARLGISDRTVWYYTEQGLVRPEVADPKGKGTTRLYSAKNIMEIAVCRKLAEHGLKLELIREIMHVPRHISRDGFNPWNPAQDTPSTGERYFILVYDPASERPAVVTTGVGRDGDLGIISKIPGFGRTNFEVCIAVDLAAIREKVRVALK